MGSLNKNQQDSAGVPDVRHDGIADVFRLGDTHVTEACITMDHSSSGTKSAMP